MAELIRMPEVLAGAAEAAIQTWLVAVGASVVLGQPLAEIETDKAVVELTAESAGVVGRLLAAEGDSVSVGEPILVMLGEGDGDGAVADALAAGGVAVSEAQSDVDAAPDDRSPGDEDVPSTVPPVGEASAGSAAGVAARVFTSPLVRRLAADQGVDIARIEGTGPNGRIVRRDLERHLAQEPALTSAAHAAPEPAFEQETSVAVSSPSASSDGSYEDVPLSRMRRAIARRLTESATTVPHFYLEADCRVDDLLSLRAQVNETSPRRVSVNDFVIKAVAGALMDVPAANAIWNADSIRQFSSVEISVAVATDGGLVTPVLRAVERMSLTSVSDTVAELARRARAGRLTPRELDGGSFSVSNLGMYGTGAFTAILNPPQSGILAVGAARRRPIVDASGDLVAATVMTVTLSADHRVLDGAVAAQWLAALQRRIENPLTILI